LIEIKQKLATTGNITEYERAALETTNTETKKYIGKAVSFNRPTLEINPQSASYWTGTCNSAAFVDDSEVRCIGEGDVGWMMFDISGIYVGSPIISIEFFGYVNYCHWPYWSVTPVTNDPLTATPDVLYNDIIEDIPDNWNNLFWYNDFYEEPNAAPGWRQFFLGGTANADLESALVYLQDGFAIGIVEITHSPDYYIYFDGWNEANPPYLIVTYTEITASPDPPYNPFPSDYGDDYCICKSSWTNGVGTQTIDLFFGTDSSLVDGMDASVKVIADTFATSYYPPDLLDSNTTYFWKVLDKNTFGETEGPLWRFTTGICYSLESFETGDLSVYPWVLGGSADWFVQDIVTCHETYAAESGNIGDYQSSELSITLNVTSDGNISFYKKVSSEGGYDYLRFYIDGVGQASWSGEVDWSYESFAVTAGSRTFKWSYAKDCCFSEGSDCGWIDCICFPPHESIHGNLDGYVTEYGLEGPIDGAIVTITIATLSDTITTTTDYLGYYLFEDIFTGTYDVTCTATNYVDSTKTGVVIIADDTTQVDFALKYSTIAVDPTNFIVTLDPDTTTDETMTITNDGPSELTYSCSIELLNESLGINPGIPENIGTKVKRLETSTKNELSPYISTGFIGTREFGDILMDYDIQTPTGTICPEEDNQLIGCEFDGTHIWVTGAGGTNGINPNQLYKYDTSGNIIACYPQGTNSASWGMRDMAFDGTYLYAGDEDGFYQIDPSDGSVTTLFTAPLPGGLDCIRALAWVPYLGFCSNNWSGDIIIFDAAGTQLGSLTAPVTGSIYGMTYDNINNCLWLYSQTGTPATTFSQYNIATEYETGLTYQVPLLSGATDQFAGGVLYATDLINGKAVLGGITQGDPVDRFFAMELCDAWLTITANASGTVPGYSENSVDVTLHFDTYGLNPDSTYTANILIHNNSADSLVTIPVALNLQTGIVGVDDIPVISTKLNSNFPNPFRHSTTISFSCHRDTENAEIIIYNIKGQKVKKLVNEKLNAGEHQIFWNGKDESGNPVSSGIYFYRLEANNRSFIKKMLLMR
nr:carboxypeptidase regulatory-like domain-containing protein [Candidatus Cloacimonadota bacterium]